MLYIVRVPQIGSNELFFGRPILCAAATTQRGLCVEAFVSILSQSQSQKSLPGGGDIESPLPRCLIDYPPPLLTLIIITIIMLMIDIMIASSGTPFEVDNSQSRQPASKEEVGATV